jgi:hypothetical protein
MGIDGKASDTGMPAGLPLAEVYRLLDDQRLLIDQRLAALPPDDLARDAAWLELEQVLNKLRAVVRELTRSRASHLAELRAKAAILAQLLQPEQADGGPPIPDNEKSALALSITDDIAGLSID